MLSVAVSSAEKHSSAPSCNARVWGKPALDSGKGASSHKALETEFRS